MPGQSLAAGVAAEAALVGGVDGDAAGGPGAGGALEGEVARVAEAVQREDHGAGRALCGPGVEGQRLGRERAGQGAAGAEAEDEEGGQAGHGPRS